MNINDFNLRFNAPYATGVLSGQGSSTSLPGSGGAISGGGGSWFSNFLDPQVAFPIAAQLIGGRNLRESLAGGLAAAGPALADARKRQALNDLLKAKSFGTDIDPETRAYMAENPAFAEDVLKARLAPRYDTGLQPQWAQDANGAWHQFLPSRTGEAKELQYPAGMTPMPPVMAVDQGTQTSFVTRPGGQAAGTPIVKDVAGKASATAQGSAQGAAAADLPRAMNAADMMVKTINATLADPYLDSMVGPIQGRLPNVSGEAARVQSYLDQIKGQAFLQAYQVLKGGGQITEIEGEKATDALNRLKQTTMGSADYRKALVEFRDEVTKLAQIAQIRAHAGAVALPEGAAPAGASAPAAAAPDPLGIR